MARKTNRKALRGRPRRARRVLRKKPMVRLIKRVLQRYAEKKVQVYAPAAVTPLVLRTGSGGIANNVFPLSPYLGYWNISQGAGQGDRVGNKVRTVSATLNVQLAPTPYNATTNPAPTPMYVRLWFVRYKAGPFDLPPSASLYGGSATFLQMGNTNTGLTGTFQDLQARVNRDAFTYLGSRTYKIGTAEFATTGSTAAYGNFTNNDFKLCVVKRVNVTKMLPRVLSWDDNSAPTSNQVCMLVQPIYATGIAPGAAVTPLTFKFFMTYRFTDD